MIKRPLHLLIAICAAQVLSMLPFAGWPVLLGELQGEWSLTNTQAGMIGGLYFVGYVSAVLVLVSATDMLDPRIVYIFSALAAASGAELRNVHLPNRSLPDIQFGNEAVSLW